MDARASHFNMGSDQSKPMAFPPKPNTSGAYRGSNTQEFQKNMAQQKTCNVKLGGQSDLNSSAKLQTNNQTFFRWIQPKIE
jgi:hypothetical protein